MNMNIYVCTHICTLACYILRTRIQSEEEKQPRPWTPRQLNDTALQDFTGQMGRQATQKYRRERKKATVTPTSRGFSLLSFLPNTQSTFNTIAQQKQSDQTLFIFNAQYCTMNSLGPLLACQLPNMGHGTWKVFL